MRKKCLKIQQSFTELWKGKTLGKDRRCWQKHISLWWLFGQMLPDLRWHSLSPLASEASEAGNRISPQAKPWRTSLMTLPLTPGMHKRLKIARPQWKSKAIIFTSTSGYVYRPLSHQWLKPGQLKQRDYYHYFYVHLVIFVYFSGFWWCFADLFSAQPWPSRLQNSSSHQGPQDHQQQSSWSREGHRPGAQRDASVRVKRRDGPGRSRAALWRHVQSLPGIQPRWGTRLKGTAKYSNNSSYLSIKKKRVHSKSYNISTV